MNKLARTLRCLCLVLPTALGILCNWSALGQPTLVSSTPPNMEAGSPTTQIVFVFSEAMNTSLTSVMVMDANGAAFLTVSQAWSAGNTVLTCTPLQLLTVGHMIVWQITGQSAGGEPLGEDTAGMFTVSGGIVDSGCSNTNGPLDSFTVAKGALYEQTSSAVPALNTFCPYSFVSCLQLVCPHTVLSATVAPQGGAAVNMPFTSVPGHPVVTICGFGTQTALDAAYPSGLYLFDLLSATSNQQVTATFPAGLAQPPAPHLTNYLEAQSVDPYRPFRLGWEPFAGGTAADCIYVELQPNAFHTPAISEPGARNGTATSVTIPEGTFQPNSEYSGAVTFYHYTLTTNAAGIILAYRAASTEFTLRTTSGSDHPITITNWAFSTQGAFTFDVVCTPSGPLVVERKTDLTQAWQPIWTNSAPTTRFPVTDSSATTRTRSIYRVRTGP